MYAVVAIKKKKNMYADFIDLKNKRFAVFCFQNMYADSFEQENKHFAVF